MIEKVYYGTPRLVGEFFRATKIPSIILLIGFFGVPLAVSAYMTTYAARNHSDLPVRLFAVGYIQFKIESDPVVAQNLPDYFSKAMQTTTPEQKQRGKDIFEYFAVFIFAMSVIVIWWLSSAFRFAVNRSRHRPR
jgi:hypothetical protein